MSFKSQLKSNRSLTPTPEIPNLTNRSRSLTPTPLSSILNAHNIKDKQLESDIVDYVQA